MAARERLELGFDAVGPAKLQVALDAIELRRKEQRIQSPGLGGEHRTTLHAGQRLRSPELERCRQLLSSAGDVTGTAAGLALRDEILEAAGIDPRGVAREPVARGPGNDHVAVAARSQHAPQPGYVHLHALGGRRRRRLTPQLVDDSLDGDDLAGADCEQREERALLRTAQ